MEKEILPTKKKVYNDKKSHSTKNTKKPSNVEENKDIKKTNNKNTEAPRHLGKSAVKNKSNKTVEKNKQVAKPVEASKKTAKPVEAKKQVSKPVEAKKQTAKPVETKKKIAKPVENKKQVSKPVEAKQKSAKPKKDNSPKLLHNANTLNVKPSKKTKKSPEYKVFSLGGLGVVGMNMYCIESKSELIVIDAGILFADEADHGVNYIIPDFSYLIEHEKKIVGLFITHGHEDHIGAIPFLLQKVHIPTIYATGLAVGLIRNKMQEFSGIDYNITPFEPSDIIKTKDFEISFFRTNHSIPDSVGVALKTKLGYIVNTGDFKFDFNPIGPSADYYKMTKLGEEGVYCLLSESTNADIPQFSSSEKKIGETLSGLFQQIEGRIIVATFASNVYRVQQILDASIQSGRKIIVFGHSMEKTIEVASRLGYIKVPEGWVFNSRELKKCTTNHVTILCTGSQGEPMAALSRIANGTHKQIKLMSDDTVIYSSKPIPGNEQFINRNINKLVKAGAHVIKNNPLTDTHTTGHASQNELKMMLTFMKPKYFVPVHGEFAMLKLHVDLATSLGIPAENCFVLKPGDVLSCKEDKATVLKNQISLDDTYLDNNLSDVDSSILKERKKLADEGILSISYFINKKKKLLTEPVVKINGFATPEAGNKIKEAIKAKSIEIFTNVREKQPNLKSNSIEKVISNQMIQYVYSKMERKPLVVTKVMVL